MNAALEDRILTKKTSNCYKEVELGWRLKMQQLLDLKH